MGLDAQQMLQNDPEYLARQLARKEIQQYQNFQNPQLGLAATSGALLGRGIANLFGGRGFFDVSDPALRKVSEVQSLYNEAMQSFDPNNPGQSYAQLATTLAQRGYGREAALAAAEANKYVGQTEDRDLKRQEIEARIRVAEAQAAATAETAAQRAAAAEEAQTKRVEKGVTTKGILTFSIGNGEEVYIINDEGKREKYDSRKHGRYETAVDKRTPPAPSRPSTITDVYKNKFILNPDGTLGPLILPGLLPPGQTPKVAPGAATAPKGGLRTIDQLRQDLAKNK